MFIDKENKRLFIEISVIFKHQIKSIYQSFV